MWAPRTTRISTRSSLFAPSDIRGHAVHRCRRIACADKFRGIPSEIRALIRALTFINVLFIVWLVIKSFADRESEKLFRRESSCRFPVDIQSRAFMRLMQIDAATRIEDLRLPPSSRLERLKGGRKGQWSIRINNQWRLRFRFVDGAAFDVEITDYH